MKKILISVLILLLLAAAGYWYFFMRTGSDGQVTDSGGIRSIFNPFNRGGVTTPDQQGNIPVDTGSVDVPVATPQKIPALRLLSNTPVGGYGASTTGSMNGPQASSTTLIRWVDRGRGNVYEARGNSSDIITLSNTVVPRIAESVWDKNLSSFVAQTFSEDGLTASGVYAELRARIFPRVATSTSIASSTSPATLTPHELKGRSISGDILAYAASPKRDRVFILVKQNNIGVGYVMNFNGSASTQIFTTPLTQITVEWPEEQTIAITTKGAADERGFLYFVNPRTGTWKRILGPLPGLSTKVSTDAKRVFISAAGNANNVITSIYSIADNNGVDAIVRTMADKCVWGKFYKELVYCAVPSEHIPGTYPDDWYKGIVSFADKIWKINAVTNEINLVSSIFNTSDRVIDAFNLGLDDRDQYLIFMNKNDLSLWSLDLVQTD